MNTATDLFTGMLVLTSLYVAISHGEQLARILSAALEPEPSVPTTMVHNLTAHSHDERLIGRVDVSELDPETHPERWWRP